MVVIATVLVVGPHQQRLVPRRPLHDRRHHLSGEGLPRRDVLGVLLRAGPVVGVDDREAGQAAGRRRREELLDGHDFALVGGVVGEPHLDGGQAAGVEVIAPADAVVVQAIEDGAVGRGGQGLGHHVVDHAGRRGRREVAAVGKGLAEQRREPAVGQRERRGQRVVEGQLRAGPVAHRHRAAGRGDEAHVGAAVVLPVAGLPALGGTAVLLAVARHGEGQLPLSVARRVPVGGPAVGAQREAVAPGQHAQVVVVAVVLHHEHHEVLDLGHGVGARRPVRKGQRLGPATRQWRRLLAGRGGCAGAGRRRPPTAGAKQSPADEGGGRRGATSEQGAPGHGCRVAGAVAGARFDAAPP